jgi:hypothetical protein
LTKKAKVEVTMRKYFEEIEDTRQQWKIKYLLVEVIVMAIVAVTAGADTWGEIANIPEAFYKPFKPNALPYLLLLCIKGQPCGEGVS